MKYFVFFNIFFLVRTSKIFYINVSPSCNLNLLCYIIPEYFSYFTYCTYLPQVSRITHASQYCALLSSIVQHQFADAAGSVMIKRQGPAAVRAGGAAGVGPGSPRGGWLGLVTRPRGYHRVLSTRPGGCVVTVTSLTPGRRYRFPRDCPRGHRQRIVIDIHFAIFWRESIVI